MVTTSTLSIHVAYNEGGRRIGETHHNASIPDAVVDLIRERHEDDGVISNQELAEEFGLSLSTVKKLLQYQRRAQTPARWKALVS
jgi:DNA invertase Pin-like site-specific DNA recombinase